MKNGLLTRRILKHFKTLNVNSNYNKPNILLPLLEHRKITKNNLMPHTCQSCNPIHEGESMLDST